MQSIRTGGSYAKVVGHPSLAYVCNILRNPFMMVVYKALTDNVF
jgi:hypothetical protein